MAGDLVQNLFHRRFHPPSEIPRGVAMVHHPRFGPYAPEPDLRPRPYDVPESSSRNAFPSTCNGSDASAAIEYTRLLLRNANPAWNRFEYSRTFTSPARLCSKSRRLVDPFWTQPSTLGFPAASITQAAGGSASKSLAWRASPCTSVTPSFRRRPRLVSDRDASDYQSH